ncbi:predicted protein [Thalassiosira pseudonana CCMP1335]|uniref:F5/8 type C domain-containing protein n=1 Tax=Thalassiosira pseudonana TaxID=35128 RepID=B8LDR4_THAPS|nr:predicted protein [Thalassiosira pseudonana CCMP1335]EED86485.1 predicted protein [Thalassiosira pseudonana CCMP1335]
MTTLSSALLTGLCIICSGISSVEANNITPHRILATTSYDLANANSAERFFSDSAVEATLFLGDGARIEWTATTPVAVACGSSVLLTDESSQGGEFKYVIHAPTFAYRFAHLHALLALFFSIADSPYFWQHIYSESMDPSIPSVDHIVSISLDTTSLQSIVDISTQASVYDSLDESSNDVALMSFRLFAFMPYAKGVMVSHMYALELPLDIVQSLIDGTGDSTTTSLTIDALDFSGGQSTYNGDFASYSAPNFLFGLWGEDSNAFSKGPCYESVKLSQGNSDVIVIGGSNSDEGACVCEVEDSGFRQRELQMSGSVFCNEYSSPLVATTLSEGVVGFQMSVANEERGVASSFHYGLTNPVVSDDGSVLYSADAFDKTNGKEGNVTMYHGLVRADEVSANPSAVVALTSFPLNTGDSSSDESLSVGGVWIDSQMKVGYSRETQISVSEMARYVSDTVEVDVTSTGDVVIRESSLCPAGSIRNLALLSEGADILEVSSFYSSVYGATKAIDGDSSTEWSSAYDGNNAFISIQLPYPSNVVYVEFHTRTMTSSAQIYEYLVEAGNEAPNNYVVASSCFVPDATKLYECDLDLMTDGDLNSMGVRDVTVVTFRVVDSSGGNTGAIDIGVYGCSLADEELALDMTTESAGSTSSASGSVSGNDTIVDSSVGGTNSTQIGKNAPKSAAKAVLKITDTFLLAVIIAVCNYVL